MSDKAGPEDAERARDRELHPERDTAARRGQGAVLIACCFALAMAGALCFLLTYWTNANHVSLGLSLAAFLGGTGICLVVYARRLMPDKQAEEPREQLASNPREREETAAAFREGAGDIPRHGLLEWMALATAGFAAAIVVSMFRSFGKSPVDVLYSTVWKRGQRLSTPEGAPVSVDALAPGNTMIVFPENSIGDQRAQTVLIRVDERLIPRNARASWAPMGYLAYSRVCTHAGCPVALYEVTTCLLTCPCHQSTFDVLRGARPTGGPAARPLPQLPLYVDGEGNLRAADGFTAPPGPGFWGMPPSPHERETS